jgi:predicted acylesterase/phospholipase RssA
MPCALVLSAGGLFGAYQAGVWNVLSKRFQPDIVAGASAGAINGWAIAGGCPPAEIAAMWLDPATAAMTRPSFSAVPWKGWIDPAPLERHLRDMYARFKPRVPYSATMVEVPGLRLVRVPGERITPEHILASCAVPLGYPPVRIGGKFYVDGGVLDILPVWAAAEMGATCAIAVNSLSHVPSRMLRVALRLFHLLGQKPAGISGLQVIEIGPPIPLGTVRDSLVWREENIRRWIRQGEEDAAAAAIPHGCS